MKFTDIDINFDVKYEGQQNCPKILSMDILKVFSDHHRVGAGSPGHLFSSGSPIQTHIFAILKNLVKNLYAVYVQF